MDISFFSNRIMDNTISKLKLNKNNLNFHLPQFSSIIKKNRKKFSFSTSPTHILNKNNSSTISTINITNRSQNEIVLTFRKRKNFIFNFNSSKSYSDLINQKDNSFTSKNSLVKLENQRNKSVESNYNRIVINKFKERKKPLIPNQFNLIYCDNQKQFNLIEKLKNKKRIKEGKIIFQHIDDKESKEKINYIKDSINKIGGILNYSFPKIFLKRVKLDEKFKKKLLEMQNKNKSKKYNKDIIDENLIFEKLK